MSAHATHDTATAAFNFVPAAHAYTECASIAGLDLDPIKVKLMHEQSGEGWSREKADAVEAEYRRFLYLMKFFPNEEVAPLAVVDIFWHYHILDTMKYAVDCEQIFGYFLHHFPYVGLRDDEQDHETAAERMSALYQQTFGEPYLRDGYRGDETGADAADSTNDAAFSIRVPQDAIAGSAATTAFSIRVPQNAVGGSANRPAFSIRVPQNAIEGSTARTAFSIRVPQNAVAAKAAETAFSIRVPQNAIAATAGKMAFSIRVPQSAIAGTAPHAAFSIRVPQNATSAAGGNDATTEKAIFKLHRPVLAAA